MQVSITGHMHPYENVHGLVEMRNVHISNTAAAGIRMTSHSASDSMWVAKFRNVTLKNVGTTWPVPQVQPTAKDPRPCVLNAAPIVVGWFSHDVHLPWDRVYFRNGTVGGLVIENALVIDSRNRPFISAGSPTFSNGTRYIDLAPQLIQNVTFRGRVINTARGANPHIVCGVDLGRANNSTVIDHQARGIDVVAECSVRADAV